MINRILSLYPNLQHAYNDIEDKKQFEHFLINQFKIEKRPLDQILNNTLNPVYYTPKTYNPPKKLKKKTSS